MGFRPVEVIRAELDAIDAELAQMQTAYRGLAERRLRLAAELVAPAMQEHLAERRGADQVAEGSARDEQRSPGSDTPRGTDQ